MFTNVRSDGAVCELFPGERKLAKLALIRAYARAGVHTYACAGVKRVRRRVLVLSFGASKGKGGKAAISNQRL